jgi:acyl-CoA synthetase (AMP-forming)/AMP-acid ligase II
VQNLPRNVPGLTALHLIRDRARSAGDRPALILPKAWSDGQVTERVEVSYAQLWQRTSDFARGFEARGFVQGDRVLVIAPLSADVYAFLLAIFARGLTAVFIDATNRSQKSIRAAISIAKPRAVLGSPKLMRYRWLLPSLWGATAFVADGKAPFAATLEALALPGPQLDPVPMSSDAEAMVSFTSGSTGQPKGVVRTYGVSLGQHQGLTAVDGVGEADVHLTSLPVMAFHNLMAGATTVLPTRDFMRRDGTDVRAVVAQLQSERVTHLSGAPAFVEEVADELLRQGIEPSALRFVLTGAAPVGRKLAAKLSRAYGRAEVRIAYGSTEAEPMTSISARAMTQRSGSGYLVGRPTSVGEVRVVKLPEGPFRPGPEGVRAHGVKRGIEGEIVVCGPQVVERYLNDSAAEAQLKIRDVDGTLWHRTLDLGFFDEDGELWLTGRVPDRIRRADRLLAPLPVEAELDEVTGVRKSALIAHAAAPQGEALIELEPGAPPEAAALCQEVLAKRGLSDVKLHVVPEVAVDPRHFSKLDRPRMRSVRGKA